MTTIFLLPEPPAFLRLLGHELRWQILTALARNDRRVHELVGLLMSFKN